MDNKQSEFIYDSLRDDTDFVDMTLSCEDGKDIGAHSCQSRIQELATKNSLSSSYDLHERGEVRGSCGYT